MALPIGTEFVSGMKLKVRYEDATKLQHERTIELYEIVMISDKGRTEWIDTTDAYWTEDFLLENATLIEEGHPVGMCSNEQREVASKNFDEIKVGHWYVKRNGELMRLREGHESVWEPDGTYNEGEESPYDLMQEVEAPILVPVKRKVKKEITAIAYVDSDGTVAFYCREDEAKPSIYGRKQVKLTGTYESEE